MARADFVHKTHIDKHCFYIQQLTASMTSFRFTSAFRTSHRGAGWLFLPTSGWGNILTRLSRLWWMRGCRSGMFETQRRRPGREIINTGKRFSHWESGERRQSEECVLYSLVEVRAASRRSTTEDFITKHSTKINAPFHQHPVARCRTQARKTYLWWELVHSWQKVILFLTLCVCTCHTVLWI